MIPFSEYFTSAIYRGPLFGSVFMCLTASIVGVFVFLKKRSLVSETLSHASFPGVVIGVFIASFFVGIDSQSLGLFSILFAFIFSALALFLLEYLEKKVFVKNDTALCFILSTFFALGLLMVSQMQFAKPLFYKKSLTFLYGQVATMSDYHIVLYGGLFTLVFILFFLFYDAIKSYLFDHCFYQGLGFSKRLIECVIYSLLLLAIVIGISSVGVVLLSGMLIAPSLAARQWTDKFSHLFFLAAFFGVVSALVGVIGSSMLSFSLNLSFPTGPLIVLFVCFIALFSLLFAPKKGLIFRFVRLTLFRIRCIEENILKGIWQYEERKIEKVKQRHQLSLFLFQFIIWRLEFSGWIEKDRKELFLTKDGENKAKKIVRLHRLWEVYLADCLGIGAEKVHKSAEQIEHFITEDLEKKLTKMLEDPKEDPHKKPIPEKQV